MIHPSPRITALLALAAASVALAAARPALAGGDWNDGGIAWMAYADGLAQAKKAGKPICLVLYTDWCPHCTNFSKVFHDPKVVATAKKFVMIRVNNDQDRDVAAKYGPDGRYVPRTFFLSPSGVLDPDIHAPRPQFKYFYDERSPNGILAGMEAALKKYH